jgi:hypothetical protein
LPIHERHIKQLALFYLICFGVNQAWFLWNGLYFTALNPVFFVNKLDITGQLILNTGFPQQLLQHATLRWVLDGLYMCLPVLLCFAAVNRKKWVALVAICTAICAMLYGYCFSIMGVISIEVFIVWMLFPLVLAGNGLAGFYYRLHAIRYLFVLFFFSTAIWKIRAGGLFNQEQLAAILLQQHLPVLVSAPQYWWSKCVLWLIQHSTVSYGLYVLATAIEASFVSAFFTKKYDKLLGVLFVVFLVFDYFLMEINYFPWLPFLGCLYYSRFSLPVSQ